MKLLGKKHGEKDKAIHYEKLTSELMNRLWDRKIEHEIRSHYSK